MFKTILTHTAIAAVLTGVRTPHTNAITQKADPNPPPRTTPTAPRSATRPTHDTRCVPTSGITTPASSRVLRVDADLRHVASNIQAAQATPLGSYPQFDAIFGVPGRGEDRGSLVLLQQSITVGTGHRQHECECHHMHPSSPSTPQHPAPELLKRLKKTAVHGPPRPAVHNNPHADVCTPLNVR
jgi:hypothetical protein